MKKLCCYRLPGHAVSPRLVLIWVTSGRSMLCSNTEIPGGFTRHRRRNAYDTSLQEGACCGRHRSSRRIYPALRAEGPGYKFSGRGRLWPLQKWPENFPGTRVDCPCIGAPVEGYPYRLSRGLEMVRFGVRDVSSPEEALIWCPAIT